MDKLSYALGLGIGRQLSQMGAEDLNIDDFSQAIKDILTGKEPQVSDQEAQKLVTTFFRCVLPLSGTIIAVLSVYYGVARWNDYFTGK